MQVNHDPDMAEQERQQVVELGSDICIIIPVKNLTVTVEVRSYGEIRVYNLAGHDLSVLADHGISECINAELESVFPFRAVRDECTQLTVSCILFYIAV